jgi:hypothetical protein
MVKRIGLALIFTLCLAQTAPANAQIVSTCVQILLEYVGKPLVGELAKRAGGKIADYFGKKLENGSQSFTQQDVETLGRQGVTPCELRQAIAAMPGYGNPTGYAQQGFSAQAHCGMTGAMGYGYNLPTPQMALEMAINNCIAYGGIPECCARGAALGQP